MKEIYDWSQLEKYYLQDNLSVHEIAKIVGCKWRAVYHALKRRNIPVLGQANIIKNRTIARYSPYKQDIITMLAKQETPDIIARTLGITISGVRKAIKVLNLTSPKREVYVREKSANWKGGYKTYHGYIRIRQPEHPYATKDGYIPQHRVVMEHALGRYLLPHEIVHHINGIKDDNRIENLELISSANHMLKTKFCNDCPLKQITEDDESHYDDLYADSTDIIAGKVQW